jgi:Domain of unknown function (DUF4184)
MPYAFAHPAAVVPVAKMLGRRAVPSALAIGSMIPDVWYLVPFLDRRDTHDTLGVLWFCLPAGLVAYAAFHLIFKQPMLALLPRDLAGRLAVWATPRLPAVPWLSVLVSLLAGIATHLAWDALTHIGYLPVPEARVWTNVYLHQVLQHVSTLLGSAFLAWWLWRKLSATKPQPEVRELQPRLRLAVVAAMILLPAAAFFSVLHGFDADAIRIALRAAAVTAISVFGLMALSFCVAWRRSGASDGEPGA